jgi:hypothetical protein
MPHTFRIASRSYPAGALLIAVLAAGVVAVSASAQDSKSAAAARELGAALDAAKLDSIAAADPDHPGTWVAALYFKDSQLLVVSAQYAAPTLFVEKAKAKNFRDIYIDLNSASMAGTKVFVMDSGADGLVAKPSDNAAGDTWEEKDKTMVFDGDWKKAKLSEDAYMKTFGDADARYARMLALLAARAKGGTDSQ